LTNERMRMKLRSRVADRTAVASCEARTMDVSSFPRYGLCGKCKHVGDDVNPGGPCPACGTDSGCCSTWPFECAPQELWAEHAFCVKHKRPELALVVAVAFCEAIEYQLLHDGLLHLDWVREEPILGAMPEGCRYRDEQAHVYLKENARDRSGRNKVWKTVFDASAKKMLTRAPGEKGAEDFWANYTRLRGWRNQIVHGGRRVWYVAVDTDLSEDEQQVGDGILRATVSFLPWCLDVFAKLWNKCIHEPILARMKNPES